MVALRHPFILTVFIAAGCSSSKSDDGGFGGGPDTGGSDSGSFSGLQGEEVLSPRDNASDLAADGGSLFYSTQYDPAVFRWDPNSGEEEKITWDWRDLEAFAVSGSRFFGSFSDSGVEGWVSELLPPKDEEELASMGSDGTLFRRPGDLVFTGEGIWVVDEKLGVVWEIPTGSGSAEVLVEASGVLAVVRHKGDWVIGGEEGVRDSTGLLDSRKATALFSHEEQVWGVNVEDGLFEVGGRSWGLQGPARPGPFVFYEDRMYAVDEVGGGIWSFGMPFQ